MKKTTYFLAATLLGLAIIFSSNRVVYERMAPTPDILTHEQRAWLGALEWCESRGRAEAINPNDRDNTPSYGILQFKPETFTMFSKAYGMGGKLMDPRAQEAIVEQMIVRGGIKWSQQFPDCTKKLGTPPKLSTPTPKAI